MNRIIVFALMLFCMTMQIEAQTLSEEEVTAKMYQAFELNKAGKKAEALELFLIVGENTKQQRNEGERQVYVCSQTMACQCYELLGRYQEGYLLGKSLLQGKLNDEERKDVGHLYALNGYMYACDFIKRDERGRADYRRGRTILEEIKPYAEGEVRNYLLPKIPLTWYFEGTDYFVAQKFEEALKAYYTALAGFQELGKKKDILSTLKAIASTKYHLCDIKGADKTYRDAMMLARNTEDTSSQMDILQEFWHQNYTVGNLEQARLYAASMDSMIENTSDSNARYTYYNKKGKEARKQGERRIAEQWFLKGMAIAESKSHNTISAERYISYTNLRDLYA